MTTPDSPDELTQKISQLHQEFVTSYKERFVCENKHAAVIKCSPIWQKIRKEFKAFPHLKSQAQSQIETWEHETKSASTRNGIILSLWKNSSNKSKSILFVSLIEQSSN